MQRLLIPALLALLLSACAGGEGGAPPAMPPTPVSVATVIERPVSDWSSWSGRFQATQSAEIRARVAGELKQVHFREGESVAAGELLFSIDPREYRAAVDNARANLARAEARLDLARRELKRARSLQEAGVMSGEELDAKIGEERQAGADVEAAKAGLAQAELNLDFTRIEAPFAGRVGAAEVQAGNLIQPGATLLTTLVSVDPIRVDFEIDEAAYLRLKRHLSSNPDSPSTVRVGLSGDSAPGAEGRVVFVDNALNPATGTIRVRAELPNPDGRYTPGLFARVQLLGAETRQALQVHPQAVLTDQDRRYVYVAGSVTPPPELGGGPAYTGAIRKDVVLGPTIDGLVVVESGLSAGDQVVVNGMRKIFFPGAPVAPVEVPMDAPNTMPAPAAAGGGEG
jgi:multidrug efflux system membrane fusion protein